MKLYWAPQTRAFRISWLLEEAGVPFERVRVDLRDPAAKDAPAFRVVSALGKVPALEDGPARLTDSGAICIYVADQYPQSRLGPPVGDPRRAAFLQWTTFNNSSLEPAMVEKFQKFAPNPTAHGYGSFDLMLDAFRTGLSTSGGDWILGTQFSAADVLLGTGAWYLKKFGILASDPVLDAYVARCMARPAFQRALALEG